MTRREARRDEMKRVQLHLNHCRDNILVQGRSGPPHHHGAFSDSECAINLRSVTTSITLGSRSLFSVYFVSRQSEIARSTTMTAMMMRMMRMMIMMWCDGIIDIAVQNHDNIFLAWVIICIGGCKLRIHIRNPLPDTIVAAQHKSSKSLSMMSNVQRSLSQHCRLQCIRVREIGQSQEQCC